MLQVASDGCCRAAPKLSHVLAGIRRPWGYHHHTRRRFRVEMYNKIYGFHGICQQIASKIEHLPCPLRNVLSWQKGKGQLASVLMLFRSEIYTHEHFPWASMPRAQPNFKVRCLRSFSHAVLFLTDFTRRFSQRISVNKVCLPKSVANPR